MGESQVVDKSFLKAIVADGHLYIDNPFCLLLAIPSASTYLMNTTCETAHRVVWCIVVQKFRFRHGITTDIMACSPQGESDRGWTNTPTHAIVDKTQCPWGIQQNKELNSSIMAEAPKPDSLNSHTGQKTWRVPVLPTREKDIQPQGSKSGSGGESDCPAIARF